MSHNHASIPGVHPFAAPFVSVLIMLFTKVVLPELPDEHWHLPPIFMEIVQQLAWWAVVGGFVIAVLNYLEIKWNPFKKKKQ